MDGNPMPSRPETQLTRPAPETSSERPTPLGRPLEVSATVAGFDGAVIGSVTRHREAARSDSAFPHDLLVVSLDGDLDADTGPLLQGALIEALAASPSVCCDLSRVTFFGAAGANTVVAAHLRATATGRQFTVRGVHGITRWVLAVTRLDEMLTFAE